MKLHSIPIAWACVALLGASLLAGCGSARPDLLPVAGKVTLDGQPFEGDILFLPVGKGTTAGAKITAGDFRIDQAKGLPPGTYRVEIISYQPTGRQVPDEDLPGRMKDELAQIVPAEYNTESTLRVELTPENADALSFDLTSSD